MLSFLRQQQSFLSDSDVFPRALFACLLHVPNPIIGESVVCFRYNQLIKILGKSRFNFQIISCFHKPSSCGTIFRWNKSLSILQTIHKNSPLLPVPPCDFVHVRNVRGWEWKGVNSSDFCSDATCFSVQLSATWMGCDGLFLFARKSFFSIKTLQVSYWFPFIWTLPVVQEEKQKNMGGGINKKTNQTSKLLPPSHTTDSTEMAS